MDGRNVDVRSGRRARLPRQGHCIDHAVRGPAPDATAQAADEALDEVDGRVRVAAAQRARRAGAKPLIGATITHAADRAGGMLTPAAGSALGGLLKSVARRRPSYPTPGQALGLDLVGLDGFEQEFEATAGFVRLAAEAARHAAEERLIAPPRHVAQAALVSAADLYAPPLVSVLASPPGDPSRRCGASRDANSRVAVRRSPRPQSLQFEAFE
jgi:hypothetical protein